jgi:hypothetical protein
MQIKEQWQKLSNQKKNIYYWVAVFGVADIIISLQHSVNYFQSGQCKSAFGVASDFQACSLFEFLTNGMASLGVINIAVFIPLIIGMVFLTHFIDQVFAKENQE